MAGDNTADYMSMLENVPCNICGTDAYDIVYPPRYNEARPEDFFKFYRSSGDQILFDQLVRCQKCGLQYLNPRVKSDVILESYKAGEDSNFISQIAGRERTFKKYLRIIEGIASGRGKLLDIGTAGGSFPGVAKQSGWNVSGCEPNAWLAEWGNKHYDLAIHNGTLFDMELGNASFDLVTLWDVLEHTPDPKKVLYECRRVIKTDGLLVLSYPDIDSLVARIMGRKWVFLLSVHLYYFTFLTMQKLLAMAGFRMVGHRKLWQTLELEYILFRMKPYILWLSIIGSRTMDMFHMKHTRVSYWMGQNLLFAKPIDSAGG